MIIEEYISREFAERIQSSAKKAEIKLPDSEYYWTNTVGQTDETCWRLEEKQEDTMLIQIQAFNIEELTKILSNYYKKKTKEDDFVNVIIDGREGYKEYRAKYDKTIPEQQCVSCWKMYREAISPKGKKFNIELLKGHWIAHYPICRRRRLGLED